MKTQTLSIQAAFYFVGRASALILSFLVPLVLVRVLDKNNFGMYSQALLLYTLSFKILQFGFSKSLFYFIPQTNSLQNYYLTNTILFLVFSGAVGTIVLFIFQNWIARFFGNPQMAELIPFIGIFIFFMLIASPLEPTLISQSRISLATVIVFGSQVIRSISIILPVIFYKTVISAIFGLVGYSIVRATFLFFFFKARGGFKVSKDSLKYFKRQFSYSKNIGFAGILSNLSRRFDKIILSFYFTPEIFAIYKIGNFRIPFVQMFFLSVGEVMLPKAVRLLKMGKVDQFLEFWKRAILRFYFIGIGSFFLLQIIAHDLIVILFTEQYVSSIPVFRVIIGYILGSMLQYGIILRTTGNTRAIFQSNILSFIILVPLTFLLVKHYSLIGAAIAGLTGFYINAILQLHFSIKQLKRKVKDVFPIKSLQKILILSTFLFITLIKIQGYIPFIILRIVFSTTAFLFFYVYFCYKFNIYNLFREPLWNKLRYKFKPTISKVEN